MTLSRRKLVQGLAAVGALAAAGCATRRGRGSAPAGQAQPGARAAPPPATPLKLLILGGTGFLGPQLVEAARARGHALTLFNRGRTRPELFANVPGIELLQGDRDPQQGEGLKALEGRQWDAVIDTSGYVPRIVGASAQLLAPRVRQYVFVSTISVYADLSRPLDEGSPLATLEDATSEDVSRHYGALKALSEQAAEKAMPGRTLVLRPGLIVGRGDPTGRFTYWPVRLKRGGEVLAPGTGEDPVQYIDVRDLAEWTISMVERAEMGTFNALGPREPLTMRGLLEGVQQGVSGKAHLTWVPADFLEKHGVSPWKDLPVWIPSEGDMKGVTRISNARAVALGLGFRPVAETARDTLDWYEGLTPEQQQRATARAGLSPEREQEVLQAWHAAQGTQQPG